MPNIITLVHEATGLPVPSNSVRLNGTYRFGGAELDRHRDFCLGASKTGAGAGATVQLFAEVAGVKTNLDTALSITNASPKSWPNEYTLVGTRGIVVSGLNETDDVLSVEVGQ